LVVFVVLVAVVWLVSLVSLLSSFGLVLAGISVALRWWVR
jgi:hypothetical protein